MVGGGGGAFSEEETSELELEEKEGITVVKGGRAIQAEARNSAKALRLEIPWPGRYRKDGCTSRHK